MSGIVGFIDYDDNTYQILGYTPTQWFRTYEDTFRSVIGSFDRLTDRAALAVQPLRIDIRTIQRPTTLNALVEDEWSPVPVDELAIANGVDVDTQLSRGRPDQVDRRDAPAIGSLRASLKETGSGNQAGSEFDCAMATRATES